MMRCPDCQQPIAPENYQDRDIAARCPECQFARNTPAQLLQTIPRGVKIRQTPHGVVLRYSRFAWAKTFFYLTGVFLIVQLTEPLLRHWRNGNLSTVWPEVIFTSIAAGALAWLIYELCGKNEIRASDGRLTLFAGVGPLGVNRRVMTNDVTEIKLVIPNGNDPKYRLDCHLELTLNHGRMFTFFKSPDSDAVRFFYTWLLQQTNLIR